MEMVKNLALVMVVVASLVAVGVADARGRRGCSSCYVGGCPGGVCAVPVAPVKAAQTDAPPPPVAAAEAVQPAEGQPVTSYATVRRGLFGRRR
jgi:hypothetical protein